MVYPDKNVIDHIEKFLNKEKKFMTMNTSITGINGLQYAGCTNIVFGELPQSPERLIQLIARFDRYGNDSLVNCHFIVNDNNLDKNLLKILGLWNYALVEKKLKILNF